MLPIVRDLYKRLLLAVKDYPLDKKLVMQKIKDSFNKNKNLEGLDIHKMVAKGRYQVREMVALSKFHKYRKMRERYNSNK